MNNSCTAHVRFDGYFATVDAVVVVVANIQPRRVCVHIGATLKQVRSAVGLLRFIGSSYQNHVIIWLTRISSVSTRNSCDIMQMLTCRMCACKFIITECNIVNLFVTSSVLHLHQLYMNRSGTQIHSVLVKRSICAHVQILSFISMLDQNDTGKYAPFSHFRSCEQFYMNIFCKHFFCRHYEYLYLMLFKPFKDNAQTITSLHWHHSLEIQFTR